MKEQILGKSEVKISPIIMGMSRSTKTNIDKIEIVKAVRSGFDAGITTFDTAESYGTEQILGEALSNVRESVIFFTKVSSENLKYHQLIKSCESSLSNLDTDYIDLYQIHCPSGFSSSGNRTWRKIIPIEETMSALNKLKYQGKIRAIGVSNFSLLQLQEAIKYGCIDSVQLPYSLFWRQIEKDIVPYCIENKISILAYSPLAQGLLTGKFKEVHKFNKTDLRSRNKLFKGENYERVQQALEKLRPIAEDYQVSLSTLALAWVIAQKQTSAIVGASSAEQDRQNAKAADINLCNDDIDKIDAIGRIVTKHLNDNLFMWYPIPFYDRVLHRLIKISRGIKTSLTS
ncbi:MAG: aldo/keto reductase [Rhizonema sp. PD38]|nr:aldo/keto reductase [Rhizonema sp. PD38]